MTRCPQQSRARAGRVQACGRLVAGRRPSRSPLSPDPRTAPLPVSRSTRIRASTGPRDTGTALAHPNCPTVGIRTQAASAPVRASTPDSAAPAPGRRRATGRPARRGLLGHVRPRHGARDTGAGLAHPSCATVGIRIRPASTPVRASTPGSAAPAPWRRRHRSPVHVTRPARPREASPLRRPPNRPRDRAAHGTWEGRARQRFGVPRQRRWRSSARARTRQRRVLSVVPPPLSHPRICGSASPRLPVIGDAVLYPPTMPASARRVPTCHGWPPGTGGAEPGHLRAVPRDTSARAVTVSRGTRATRAPAPRCVSPAGTPPLSTNRHASTVSRRPSKAFGPAATSGEPAPARWVLSTS